MIDVQKIISEIILYRVRKVTGGIMVFVGFFCIAGSEDPIKYFDKNMWGFIIAGFLLIAIGSQLSEMFQWEYIIEDWNEEYRGAISYSFKMHSWIKAYWYKSNDNWAYVLCDLRGHTLSKPIRTHRSFSGFKWYSVS